jgi:hypothetical protein
MPVEPPLAKAVMARRKILRDHHYDVADLPQDRPIGIAFSGGGIRSATISLGLTQALARRHKLLAFDFLSTVSGGGYFGSFLRSLFIPSRLRGEPDLDDPEALKAESAAQMNFAMAALAASPQDKRFEVSHGAEKATYTNPFWWLRENGRYLAPGGSVGYVTAFSFIARNWVAMLYMFLLAASVLAVILQAIIIPIWYYIVAEYAPPVWINLSAKQSVPLSPILPIAALNFVFALSLGVGYWFTESMPSIAAWLPSGKGTAKPLGRATAYFERLWVFFMLLVVITLAAILRWRTLMSDLPPAGQTIIGGGLIVSLVALLGSGWLYWRFRISEEGQALDGAIQQVATSRLRKQMTDAVSAANILLLALLAIGALDTLAMVIRVATNTSGSGSGIGNIPAGLWLVAHPVAAWLIKKIQDWSKSGSQSSIGKWVSANSGAIILAIGVSLFASVFTIADLLVQKAIWRGQAYSDVGIEMAIDWHSTGVMVTVLFLLGLYACLSRNFINLSSIHTFYVSRLTRAYLGASNMERLLQEADKSKVDEVSKKDFVHIEAYQRHACAAPLHLINVTLNETRSLHASNISRLDRKGESLTFGPQGVRIGDDLRDWDRLKADDAEPLSVGQLMAISGAAASSGMGRRTTLGSSLALTFANVRLGYWWRQCRAKDKKWTRFLGPFYYFYNEMTARYSQDDDRLYLSDGGHFENSGALALMREDCKLIVVSDNEEDGIGAFEALEILMRTARIDLGREIEVLSAKETATFVGGSAKRHFFNMAKGDWRTNVAEPGGTGFALMLGIRTIGAKTRGFDSYMIWLKPRCFEGLPLDVMAYARANPSFPHQSTVDQFFEEQQWESYRRLGYEMGSLMFGQRYGVREDLLPMVMPGAVSG